MSNSLKIWLRFSLVFALGLTAGSFTASANSHIFAVKTVTATMFQMLHMEPLKPSDKVSVKIEGAPALMEYGGIVEMPGTNRYALVFSLRPW